MPRHAGIARYAVTALGSFIVNPVPADCRTPESVCSTTARKRNDGCHPPATPTGSPPHPIHLNSRVRGHTPPRRARIRAVRPREGLESIGTARARRVVRFRLSVFASPLVPYIIIVWCCGCSFALDCLLMVGTVLLYHVGNRTLYRSPTPCSFSPWPRAVSTSLRSRRIACLGGIRAPARSLPLRAGKSTPARELPVRAMALTPLRVSLADTFSGIRLSVSFIMNR